MPCDTITQLEVAEHKMNREYFISALKSAGIRYKENQDSVNFGNGESYNFKTGRLEVQEGNVNFYKKIYSKEVVKKQFAKMGWKVKSYNQQTGKYVYAKR